MLPTGVRVLAACVVVVALTPRGVKAATQLMGTIDATGANYISGITFDDVTAGTPVVGAGNGAFLLRLNPSTAATLQSYPLPALNTTRGLDYIGAGLYYQTRDQPNALFEINPATQAETRVGTDLGGGVFNFLDTALDPTTGRLWAITDQNGGELYEINRTTGVATLHNSFHMSTQLTSLAIGPTGVFYASNNSSSLSVEDQIFAINPATSNIAPITTTGYFAGNYLLDFAYDPYSHDWYGVVEKTQPISDPRSWLLVKITGITVPEPSGIVCFALLAPWMRRHRRRTTAPAQKLEIGRHCHS